MTNDHQKINYLTTLPRIFARATWKSGTAKETSYRQIGRCSKIVQSAKTVFEHSGKKSTLDPLLPNSRQTTCSSYLLLLEGSDNLLNGVNLVDFAVPREYRLSVCHLAEDATDGPDVNGTTIVRTQKQLGTSIPTRTTFAEVGIVTKINTSVRCSGIKPPTTVTVISLPGRTIAWRRSRCIDPDQNEYFGQIQNRTI